MKDFYLYIVQVNIALLVFYLLYRTLFARDTFLGIRRSFLMTILLLSSIYPLVSFSSWPETQQPLQIAIVNYTELLTVAVSAVAPVETQIWTWQNILLCVWGMGSSILLVRMLVQFVILCLMAFQGKKMQYQGEQIISLPGDIVPFSFFGWIFINPADHEEKELAEIIAHEKTHVRQYHSLDMLCYESLCIIFWFNPITWLLRKEVRQNLEFLADKKVVSLGYNRKNYQYHLLRLSNQSTAVQIVNNFNVSSLKKRIIMMNKKRTSRIGLIKYALLVPVTGLLILSANAGTVMKMAENTLWDLKNTSPQDMKKGDKVITGKVTDEKGEPLPGVSVIIKGTSIGTLTDAKGNFELKVSEPGTLNFSYVGKETENKPFNLTTNNIRISLKKDNIQLEKIVVTAYSDKKVPEEEQEIFAVVEEMPVFPLGSMQKYLAKNVKYPTTAKKNNIQGRVAVSFVVNQQGKVTNAKVVKSVDASLDQEALRVVNEMPDWKPGKQRGKTVDVQFTVPIEFILQNNTQQVYSRSSGKFIQDSVLMNNEEVLFIVDGIKQTVAEAKKIFPTIK